MFIVQEIQTNNGQVALTPAVTYGDRFAADGAYHQLLAAAAVSSVDVHAVVMFDEHGNLVKREFYEHES